MSTHSRPHRIATLLAIACLMAFSALANAGLRVEVLAFTPPGAAGSYWQDTRNLPPCHAVALRDGVGAESAFNGNGDCVRTPGHEAAYGGFSNIASSALSGIAGRLRTAGYAPLLARAWTQAATTVAPVMLRGGRNEAGRQELAGTVAVSGSDKSPDVTLEFTLTRMDGAKPQFATVRETRRVRPGEPNYFDHPLFGVIVQVTAVP